MSESRLGIAWHKAVEDENKNEIEHLLRQGFDANYAQYLEPTAIILTTMNRNIELMRLLLAYGADPTITDFKGNSAITYGLLESRQVSGRTYPEGFVFDSRPLELLFEHGYGFGLKEAVLLADGTLVRDRLMKGASPNTGTGTYDGSVLQAASKLGLLSIVTALLDYGADPNETDDIAVTPLLEAAGKGHKEVVLELIAHGADINRIAYNSISPLASACLAEHKEIVEILLALGASRGLTDTLILGDLEEFDRLLEYKILDDIHVDWLSTACGRLALLAVKLGRFDKTVRLLDLGAANFVQYDERSLVAQAAKYGHTDLVKLLLSRGANPRAVGKEGIDSLGWAMKSGHHEIAELIRKNLL